MADWTPKAAGAEFEYSRDPQAARAVPQGHGRAVGARAQERQCAGRRSGRPRARRRLLPDRRASEEDRRRRHPERHLRRSGRGAASRPADALLLARARLRRLADRRQLRLRLFLRLHQQPGLARTDDADAARDQSAPRLRAAVRRHRHQPVAGNPRAAAAAPPQHSRSRHRAHVGADGRSRAVGSPQDRRVPLVDSRDRDADRASPSRT